MSYLILTEHGRYEVELEVRVSGPDRKGCPIDELLERLDQEHKDHLREMLYDAVDMELLS